MAVDDARRQDLLWRIDRRRAAVQAFLRDNRPRTRRRATITVVLSSLAAEVLVVEQDACAVLAEATRR